MLLSDNRLPYTLTETDLDDVDCSIGNVPLPFIPICRLVGAWTNQHGSGALSQSRRSRDLLHYLAAAIFDAKQLEFLPTLPYLACCTRF